jgi:hypothetical protein
MLNDPKVIKAAASFLKVIIRRPHAYALAEKYKQAPIPGFLFLDSAGAEKKGFVVPESGAVEEFLKQLDRHSIE